MTNPTCITPDCKRPVWVKRTGECSTCQSRRYRRENPGMGRTRYDHVCEACGTTYVSEARQSRYCTLTCKGDAYRKVCKIPADHAVNRLRTEAADARRAVVAARKFTPEVRECRWCGAAFLATVRSQVFCTANHKVKAKRNRRRGAQYGSTSHYTWAEFMRILSRFDRRCAYCEQPIEGQADPDHVVPLSKGGSNSITNILPSCRLCNSDKRDLLLAEWALDRSDRGKPTRVISWAIDDPRVQHLTVLA